jgi:hypothetical protein
MKVLMVLNRNPYDGSDVTWNALRLGEKLLDRGMELRIFLMNDSVDLAREGVEPPAGYFNLTEMLTGLISKRSSGQSLRYLSGALWHPQGEEPDSWSAGSENARTGRVDRRM